MIRTSNYKDLIWLDLKNPSHEEIEKIMHDYEVPKEAAGDLLSPTPKQRVVEYKNCVYIVMHFPELRNPKAKDHRKEIDFILGKKFIVTVHYDSIHSIDTIEKNILDETTDEIEYNAGHIFHKIIKNLYHTLLRDVEVIKEALSKAENGIFKGDEKHMVVELSKIHRDILRFRNAIIPHREAITALFAIVRNFYGEKYEYFIHDMSAECQRVERRMQNNKDMLDELRLTNNSLLYAKQNEAMKGLTMMAFITFPLSLIAAIFSMPTHQKPIIGGDFDFSIIILIMISVVIGSITLFNYKKWL
jgi:magnesium transporter